MPRSLEGVPELWVSASRSIKAAVIYLLQSELLTGSRMHLDQPNEHILHH